MDAEESQLATTRKARKKELSTIVKKGGVQHKLAKESDGIKQHWKDEVHEEDGTPMITTGGDNHNHVEDLKNALAPHVLAASQQLHWAMQDSENSEDIATGWRTQMLFKDRFNLGPEDLNLIPSQDFQPRGPSEGIKDPYKITLAHLLPQCLGSAGGRVVPICLISLGVLLHQREQDPRWSRRARPRGGCRKEPRHHLFREHRWPPGHCAPGRQDRRHHALSSHDHRQATPDLLRGSSPQRSSQICCGFGVVPRRAFAEQDITRFSGHLETRAEEVHVYSLLDGVSAKEDFVTEAHFESLTNIALARSPLPSSPCQFPLPSSSATHPPRPSRRSAPDVGGASRRPSTKLEPASWRRRRPQGEGPRKSWPEEPRRQQGQKRDEEPRPHTEALGGRRAPRDGLA